MSAGYTNSAPNLGERNTSLTQLLKHPLQKLEGFFVAENKKEEVQRLFIIKDDKRVQRFLERHPLLIGLLLEAHTAIEKFFPDSQLRLNASYDYDAPRYKFFMPNDNEELEISILTHLNPKEAIRTLEQFYDAWWATNWKRAKDKISIGLEFV